MVTDADIAQCLNCHCLVARRIARAITRLYEAKLRSHGLRATQFSVLVALATAGQVRIGDLAEALGLERTTLTRGIVPLERNGWVETDRSSDARERPLRLTAAGRSKLKAAFPAWRAAQEIAGKKFAAPVEVTEQAV